jgi:CspA family cold shock protein
MNQMTVPPVVHGRVKWFDPVKGFGFVVPDEGGADILLHSNVLRNFGQSSVATDSLIAAVVQQAERGLQVTEIVAIEAPAFDEFESDEADVTDLSPARVKWFDRAKGFGFANVFGSTEDIFIHAEILRRSGLADLQPGEAVGLQVIDGNRGRMATVVTSWEAAVRD